MKKILLLTGNYPPDIGGPASFVPQLEEFCKSRGILTATVAWSDGNFSLNRLGSKIIIRISRQSNFLWRVFLTSVIVLVFWMRGYKVFTNSLEYCALLTKAFGGSVTHKLVGDLFFEREMTKQLEPINFLKQRSILEGAGLDWTQKIYWSVILNFGKVKLIVPSYSLAEHFKKRGYRGECMVVPNYSGLAAHAALGLQKNLQGSDPFELILGRSKARGDFINIAMWGRLVPWKNYDALITALKTLGERDRSSSKKIGCLIIGDGPDDDRLKELTKELNTSNPTACRIVGAMTIAELYPIIEHTDIYVNLSSYEGMSHSLLEALDLGKVTLVSSIDANREAVARYKKAKVVYVDNPSDVNEVLDKLKIAIGYCTKKRKWQQKSDGGQLKMSRTDILNTYLDIVCG